MSENRLFPYFEHIPEIFYPEGKKQPFNKCTVCGKELIESNVGYAIEKSYRQNPLKKKRELVFEFVYCFDCMEELRSALSKESLERVDAWFAENTKMEERNKQLVKHELFEVDIWLHNCVVKNKSIDEVEEFQIYAFCNGDQLIYHHAPYMVCGDALEEVSGLLSDKTIDQLNDFWAEHSDLPPELEEIFKKKPILF